ncbi:TIM44-like domain-containing protein [Lactococcus sp. NH2-7C]|uniref:TIM44-like domain-containing protein n=1 Tax=Lactococcus sp. NH2-7C TaxID=2879149 RepID=UPI001CDB90C3|nr:TIM44-like domain-containing protein [Lactococcus sp. NH2-7C]MCA2390536.1 TIM44-like domain-containing protein [Lactococcus sp. NH2-7C]WGV31508.1 TIM44-like domain-containing protein [Lactococcus sp. NH2-7C]
MRKKQKIFITALIALICVAFIPHAHATAGGFHGGGFGIGFHGSGSGHVYNSNYSSSSTNGSMLTKIILAIVFVSITAILATFAIVKSPKEYCQGIDIDDSEISDKIKRQFLDIQNAWNVQDISRASNLYSERLYKKHNQILLQYSDKRIVNYTKNIEIEGLSHHRWKQTNKFEVDIYFKAIDYVIDKDTQQILKGSSNSQQRFRQRWTFIVQEDGLLVDKIKEFRVY